MKVVIAASSGISLKNFRGDLIKRIRELGHEVICISNESNDEMLGIISELGTQYIQINCRRTGTNPFRDLRVISAYKKALKELKPDVFLAYMSKPIAYGGYAAKKLKISNCFYLVNGLENAYYRSDLKSKILRLILNWFYKNAFSNAKAVIFQNSDDPIKIRKTYCKTNRYIVFGSGVNMDSFPKCDLPQNFNVLICSRLLWSKGIREFVEAAKLVKRRYPSIVFTVVGGFDDNQESLSKSEMDKLVSDGVVEYKGFQSNVKPFLENSSVFVLPSYHEGLPRSVLEAMATGRPIITTNAPGCKETVIDGYNGYLVDVGDYEVLSKKIITLYENTELLLTMANNSYELCKKKFEVSVVNKQLLNILELGEKQNETL